MAQRSNCACRPEALCVNDINVDDSVIPTPRHSHSNTAGATDYRLA
jgi:hypothetical protein